MWRKASSSAGNGACVEVAFHKASRSGDSANCVEVGSCSCTHGVLVRDSKDPDGPVLTVSADSWRVFLAGIRAGRYEYGGAP